jgi:GT2 family glycosyltransferase
VTQPAVSVVILTWNSELQVAGAIESALALRGPPVEVLVADNNSEDETLRVVEPFGRRVRVACFESNLGYCQGNNRAIAITRGEFVVVLNPDCRLHPSFLDAAMPAFSEPRVGIVAPRLMRPDRVTVDSTGQFLARSRKTIDRGYGKPFDSKRDRAGSVLAACGAAAIYRRAMIEDIADGIEFFDPDFFAFHEDLEVGWRAWRAGWTAVHVPEAIAIHERSSGVRHRAGQTFARPHWLRAHIVKNRALTSLRHDRIWSVGLDLPWIAARDLALYSGLLLTGPKVFIELWRHRGTLRRAWAKRRRDRRRSGRWGRWHTRVPQRGLWKA